MNLETKIIIYKFTPQVFTLTPDVGDCETMIRDAETDDVSREDR